MALHEELMGIVYCGDKTELRFNMVTPFRTDLLPAPSQPEIDALSATSVSLRWYPGSADEADFYTVEYFRTDTGAMQSEDVQGTSHTIGRLEPFTEYVFRVYAINEAGRGDGSYETRITTTEFRTLIG